MSSSNPKAKKVKDRPSTNASKTKIPDSEVERPLNRKVFHVNVKRQQTAKRLKEDLEYLGGTVDPFLNRDVWYVITDDIEAKETKGNSTANQSAASPAVSTPSPFCHTKGCVGSADSPSMISPQDSGPVTRGQAILQKAFKSQRPQGGSSALANARKLGIHVYHIDAIEKYIAREKKKLQQLLGAQKAKGSHQYRDHNTRSTSKERRLTKPFLKYEDTSRQYRPVTKEFTSVPRVLVDTARGSCPYDPHPLRKENREQRAERNCDEGQATPSTVKKSTEVQMRNQSSRVHSSKKQRDIGVKEKRRGYCECCTVKYEDLDKHLVSNQHKEFVTKQNNYVNLDRMISEGPDIDQFLEDVMKYHRLDNINAQTTQQEMDEVILVSSPLGKSPKRAKAAVATVTKPDTFALPKSLPLSPCKRPNRSPSKGTVGNPGGQTLLHSPRTSKLSRRQRVSPRLLASGQVPTNLLPETQLSDRLCENSALDKKVSIPNKTNSLCESKEKESSIFTVDRLHGESRIVPPRPSSSEGSSLYRLKDKKPTTSGNSPGQTCGRHGLWRSHRKSSSQEIQKDCKSSRRKDSGGEDQSNEHSNVLKTAESQKKTIEKVVLDQCSISKDLEKESASLSKVTRQKHKDIEKESASPSKVTRQKQKDLKKKSASPSKVTRQKHKDLEKESASPSKVTRQKYKDLEKESASPSKATRQRSHLAHQQIIPLEDCAPAEERTVSETWNRTDNAVDSKHVLSNAKKTEHESRLSSDHDKTITDILCGSVNIKNRKVADIADIAEDDDNVFEPEVRRFRTPGRKSDGNFTKVSDFKKSRTLRSCAAKSIEHTTGPNDITSEELSPIKISLKSHLELRGEMAGIKEIKDIVTEGSSRKRKSEEVLQSEPKRTLKLRAMKETQQNDVKKVETKKTDLNRDDSPKSLADFKEPNYSFRRKSARTIALTFRESDKEQGIRNAKEKSKRKTFDSAKLKRVERKQALVNKLNRKRLDQDSTSEHSVQRSSKHNSALKVQDIDKINNSENIGDSNLTTSLPSNKKSKSTRHTLLAQNNAVIETPSETELPSLFQSESSVWDFSGFQSEEINKTEKKYLNLSATLDLGIEQKLEQAALNVYCIPSSELEMDQKSLSSHSSSSVDIGDMSMVFKSLENFPSEGSEWELNINKYFDNAVEDLKRRTSELQAVTPKTHMDKVVVADDSLKKSAQKDERNQQKLSSEGNTADGVAEMPSTSADGGLPGRRSARCQQKDSRLKINDVSQIILDKTPVAAVPYMKSSGRTPFNNTNSGVFKTPFPSPKKKYVMGSGILGSVSPLPRLDKIVTSTPRRHRVSEEEPLNPCISFPPDTPKDEQDIILDNYVHDETEAEVMFPKFSSPDRVTGVLSPVKHVVLSGGEIGSKPIRRRSNISMSKEGFSFDVISSPAKVVPDARKSLFPRSTSLDLKLSSPGSHQHLGSPTSSAFSETFPMNRSLSTPGSASTPRSPIFTFYTGNKKRRARSLSLQKKCNFSNNILKPIKKGLQTKRLSRKLPKSSTKKMVKSYSPRRSVSVTVSQNVLGQADVDVYEFVDEGLGESQGSSKDKSPSPKKNLVSVAIQTNEEDLEPDDTLRVCIPNSPIKHSPTKSQQITLACFNPSVNLAKRILPVEFWS